MTSLADTELLRSRWRRTLKLHAIDTVDRDDFALSGLATRLRIPSMQLLVLPFDPEAEVLHFDDSLWAWLDAQNSVDIDGRAIRFGDRLCPTAQAAALVNGDGELWNDYLAVHRSGTIELGLGQRGAWERPSQQGENLRVFGLISIVTYIWAALKFAAAHFDRLTLVGPWQLTIALRQTKGALLGNVGQDWLEPDFRCVDQNLLWHLELQDWPDEEGQQRLAFAIGDRLEDAWGDRRRRYFATCGNRRGRLDVSQARS